MMTSKKNLRAHAGSLLIVRMVALAMKQFLMLSKVSLAMVSFADSLAALLFIGCVANSLLKRQIPYRRCRRSLVSTYKSLSLLRLRCHEYYSKLCRQIGCCFNADGNDNVSLLPSVSHLERLEGVPIARIPPMERGATCITQTYSTSSSWRYSEKASCKNN